MYDSGFSIGALIFTRLPSITPTTPGNPSSVLKLSIVSLNWVPAWDQKKFLLWEEIRIILNKRDVFFYDDRDKRTRNLTIWPLNVLVS